MSQVAIDQVTCDCGSTRFLVFVKIDKGKEILAIECDKCMKWHEIGERRKSDE